MTKSIWTIEQFACPGCGIDYSATREEHRDKRSGSYNCSICETEVHRWSGTHEYFNWQAAQKIYVSLAHGEEEIQQTVQVFTAAFAAMIEHRS